MPRNRIVFFRDEEGRVPVKEWLESSVAARDGRALAKCKARLKYLRVSASSCLSRILKGSVTMSRNKRVSDVVELMDKWYGSIPGWDAMSAEEELNMQIGQAVYDLRESVGLSQADLAKLIGSNQATISRVENADYHGNAIEILKRVCFALHMPIRISCPEPRSRRQGCKVALG